MKSPFVFGKIAEGDCFTDRETESALLCNNFHNLTNTVLISPRRWGKSSLVHKARAMAEAKHKDLKTCELDLFNVRSESEFYIKFASEVLKATSSKWEEIWSSARRFLSSFVPSISVGDPLDSVKISFSVLPSRQEADDILDLAERIAIQKKISLVICIDEFQQIANFNESDSFQAKLRSHWQKHQHVAYCLYGSKRHMLTDIFTSPGKPFYKFGQNIFLEKIDESLWPGFIVSRFSSTGKTISLSQAERIVSLVDNNPYYIQQLCEMIWNRVEHSCTDEAVEDAFSALIASQAVFNLALTQTLTLTQQNLLHAIVDGKTKLSSTEVMQQYGLKNSLTVQRAKKALAGMDIIDDFGKSITLEDPVYAWWLKNIYFSL
ncbi:MAG: ATP-binding protein [Bacteroidales bacterium]|nr:ATP-binding protein [Bacteroidales bacterium]